ncbi:MAG: DNA gyrase inhibitor YacG [Paracoccaceae bacterium]
MSCPVCGRAVEAKYKPFCSRRCADVDLARWLNGSYAIPVADEENDGSPEPPAKQPPGH